jgi:hypothetical protein
MGSLVRASVRGTARVPALAGTFVLLEQRGRRAFYPGAAPSLSGGVISHPPEPLVERVAMSN